MSAEAGDWRQDASARDHAQQAVLSHGVQHNYFGDGSGSRQLDVALSISAPLGLRDDRFPLRGRSGLVAELTGLLGGGKSATGPRVRVLHGMGGCGKTSIAVEVAAEAVSRGVETWWVSATEESRFTAGTFALARRLGVGEQELRGGDTADQVWRQLTARTEPWLLVIDNADDLDMLRMGTARLRDGTGWVRPAGSLGLVVVTTRDADPEACGTWARLQSIGALPPDKAALVLADHAGGAAELGTAEQALRLAERLGGLPLALRLAGSYLAEAVQVPAAFSGPDTLRSYAEYRKVLEDGGLDRAFPVSRGRELTREQAREVIGRTWELSLDLLEHRDIPEARVMLRLLAVLAAAPVPYTLLLDPGVLASSPLLGETSGERVWLVLRALSSVGLVDLPGSAEGSGSVLVLRLHPLVRDASTPSAGDGLEDYLALSTALLKHAAEAKETGQPEEPPAWPHWQQLAPHAFQVLDMIANRPGVPDAARLDAAFVATLAALYQSSRGLYADAETQLRVVLDVHRRVLGDEHPNTLATRHSIAWTMSQRGNHAAAEAEFISVLDAQSRVIGAEAPLTLVARYEVAYEMAERGDHAGAEAEYRIVLETETRVFGADHPNTLTARHAVAYEMAQRGDHAGAEAEYRAVLAARTRILGADHPNTLATRHGLAWLLTRKGDLAAAEAEYRVVLAARTRVLGAGHPQTQRTESMLNELRGLQDNT
jgi:tetratricopeptide repeat protein/NB-ARC domain-containing protein